jgi:hypothetical protein
MTIVANTWLTFDSKGNREDLSDVIYNISPEETPLISMIGKERAKSTLHEWQTDSLASAAANKQIEGDDVAFSAVTATVRVGNYMQISNKTFIISGTEEVIDKAGRKSEIAYQTAKRGTELKRDMEFTVFSAQGGAAGNSTTARATASLNAWVKTNDVNISTGGASPTYSSGVPLAARTDGTQVAFTVTMLKDACSAVWSSGGDLKYLFVGPVNKAKASAFTGVATKNWDMSGKPRPHAIIGSADVYVSDFGTLSILPHRYQRERDAWLLDPAMLSLLHLRPFKRETLAKTGDAEKRMLLVEWGLKVKQEAGLGLVADLTTT